MATKIKRDNVVEIHTKRPKLKINPVLTVRAHSQELMITSFTRADKGTVYYLKRKLKNGQYRQVCILDNDILQLMELAPQIDDDVLE